MWINDRIHYAAGAESLKAETMAEQQVAKEPREKPPVTLQEFLKTYIGNA